MAKRVGRHGQRAWARHTPLLLGWVLLGWVAAEVGEICDNPGFNVCCSPGRLLSEYPDTIAGFSCQVADHLFSCPSDPYPQCFMPNGTIDPRTLAACTGFDSASYHCTEDGEFIACICQTGS